MPHETAALEEADRLMTLCNSCRYCEGLCAVFPAMEMKRAFTDGDLSYLANLCHSCGACYHDCQFAPPHEFDVNVPRVMAQVRAQSYARSCWPRAAGPLFERHGTWLALVLLATVSVFLAGFVLFQDPALLWTAYRDADRFYALMPHGVMVGVFGAAFAWMVLAIGIGAHRFWADIGEEGGTASSDHLRATDQAARLTHLGGGGEGCFNADDHPRDHRRLWHHLTFYGFLLCFAATSVATLLHYGAGLSAPYAWYSLPGLLGVSGGLGMVVGASGLLVAKRDRLEALSAPGPDPLGFGFILILLATGASGLALRFLGETPLLGVLLALHLGAVLTLFVLAPYSKFVHGLYRYLALLRFARDLRRETGRGH